MHPEEAPELELRDYLRILRRRKWTILLATLITVAGAVGVSLAQTPVYQGRADVLLQPRSTESLFDPNTGQRSDPARAVQTEIQVLKSRPVRELVNKKLGSAPKVAASPVGQTDVIQVKAESTDPERAADIANAYARAYIDFRRTQAVDDLLAAGQQIQAKIADLQRRLDTLTDTPTPSPRATTATTNLELTSERDSLLAQQALFRQKLDQLQVDASLKSGGAQLVTPAVAPTEPIRPTPERNAVVALTVGLMLGVGLGFLREYLDDSLTAKEDVERAVPGVPVLALIPALGAWKDKKWSLVASLTDPDSPAAEAYRTLRTSVQFLGLDKPLKTVQVTSPSASEGKSTTIANLAVALAGAGQRVIVVDCDLRRPRIHQFFGLDNGVGLTSALVGDTTLREACQTAPQIKRLQVLASGPIPPNPSELLATNRMREVLRLLSDHADVVLVDCPPILPVTDASVLSHYVDATLLVATAGVTEQRPLRRAVELLNQVEAPLQGIVLNGVKDEGAYGYSYGYKYTSKPKGRGRANSRGEAAPMPSTAPLQFDRHPEPAPPPAPGWAPKPAPEPASSPGSGQDLGMPPVAPRAETWANPAPALGTGPQPAPAPPPAGGRHPERPDTAASAGDRPRPPARPNGTGSTGGTGNVGQLFRLIGRGRRT